MVFNRPDPGSPPLPMAHLSAATRRKSIASFPALSMPIAVKFSKVEKNRHAAFPSLGNRALAASIRFYLLEVMGDLDNTPSRIDTAQSCANYVPGFE